MYLLKRWFNNISFSLLGKMIAMILWLCFDIRAARILHVKDYAEWVFYYSVLTMCFYLGWLGINTSSKIHISRQISSKKKTQSIQRLK